MRFNNYPVILPYIPSRAKFIATVLAFLLGSALVAGLDGTPVPSDMATEEERSPAPPDNAG